MYFNHVPPNILQLAQPIKLLISDVDGVLTDGKIFFDNHENEGKSFHVQDGLGIQLLKRIPIEFAIITSRVSHCVTRRMQELAIQHVYQQSDKVAALQALIEKLQLTPAQIAYIGDDVLDIPVFNRVGFAIAVSDAHPLAQQSAQWITQKAGGTGAVREVCDLLMFAQDCWQSIYDIYQ